MPKKQCNEEECQARARGKSGKFKRHGEGKRCSESDCKASARRKSDKCNV